MLKGVDGAKLARRLAVKREGSRQVLSRANEPSAEVVLIANVLVRCRELHLFSCALTSGQAGLILGERLVNQPLAHVAPAQYGLGEYERAYQAQSNGCRLHFMTQLNDLPQGGQPRAAWAKPARSKTERRAHFLQMLESDNKLCIATASPNGGPIWCRFRSSGMASASAWRRDRTIRARRTRPARFQGSS